MDGCNLYRLVTSNMAVRLPLAGPTRSSSGAIQSEPSIFCKIFFNNHPCKILDVPGFFSNGQEPAAALLNKPVAVFDLAVAEVTRLSNCKCKKPIPLVFYLYSHSDSQPGCGFSTTRFLGSVILLLDFTSVRYNQETCFHGGWFDAVPSRVKNKNRLGVSSPQLHVSVHAEPDSRLLFKFAGSPKRHVEIFHVHASTPQPQPAFTSTFTWGPGQEANRVQPGKPAKGLTGWLSNKSKVELRSGWSVTICDTSGSPVAVASMVVPYVPKMQPVAWLIEQLGDDEWVPWGRLAAWHERQDRCVHIRFEKDSDARPVDWSVNLNQGGTLSIDYQAGRRGGFMVSASVAGERSRAKPTVQVSAKHVKCAEDAASFLALAAAINLSVHACRRFT